MVYCSQIEAKNVFEETIIPPRLCNKQHKMTLNVTQTTSQVVLLTLHYEDSNHFWASSKSVLWLVNLEKWLLTWVFANDGADYLATATAKQELIMAKRQVAHFRRDLRPSRWAAVTAISRDSQTLPPACSAQCCRQWLQAAGVQVQFDNLWMSGGSRAANLQCTVGKYNAVLTTLPFNPMTKSGQSDLKMAIIYQSWCFFLFKISKCLVFAHFWPFFGLKTPIIRLFAGST